MSSVGWDGVIYFYLWLGWVRGVGIFRSRVFAWRLCCYNRRKQIYFLQNNKQTVNPNWPTVVPPLIILAHVGNHDCPNKYINNLRLAQSSNQSNNGRLGVDKCSTSNINRIRTRCSRRHLRESKPYSETSRWIRTTSRVRPTSPLSS